MVIVERVPQAITDHAVDEFQVAHLLAGPQMRDMRSKRNRPQARAADLVDAPGAAFDRKTGNDMCLTRRVLTLTRSQDVAEDGLFDFGFLDACARHHFGNHRCSELVSRCVGKSAVKAADGCSCRRNDHHIGHAGVLSLCLLAAKSVFAALDQRGKVPKGQKQGFRWSYLRQN